MMSCQHVVHDPSDFRDEILWAEVLFDLLAARPEIEPLSQILSKVTFRFVPLDLAEQRDLEPVARYLDRLNQELLRHWEDREGGVSLQPQRGDRIALEICAGVSELVGRDLRQVTRQLVYLGREVDRLLRAEAFLVA